MKKSMIYISLLTAGFLTTSTFANPTPIETNACIKNIDEQRSSPGVLYFDNCRLEDKDIAEIDTYLTNHPRIFGLSLYKENLLSPSAIIKIADHSNLKMFVAVETQADDETAAVLATNKNIQIVELLNTNVTSAGVKALNKNTSIRELALGGHNILNDESIQAISENPTLLSFYAINDTVNLAHLKVLANTNSSKKLGFYNSIITPEGAEILAKSSLAQLEIVNTNEDMTKVAEILAKNHTMNELLINDGYISDEGVKALAENETLTFLDLTNNKITSKGAAYFAKNKTLGWLWLSRNEITDAGAVELAKNTNLGLLILDSNQIGSEGAIALAKNTTLAQLDVSRNHIGAAGLAALANSSIKWINTDDNDGTTLKMTTKINSIKHHYNFRNNLLKLPS
jgi:hypothetical protein